MKRCWFILLPLAGLCPPCAAGATAEAPAKPTILKIATLAPEGSSWMRSFKEWQREIEAHSGGRIRIAFQAGGTAGDERAMVRKMGIGQLAGAAVTSIGLGLIQGQVRVLELPMLIQGYKQLDCVRDRLDLELRRLLLERGYVLLAWGDVGPIHFFSKIPLRTVADLRRTKPWLWTDDPLIRELYRELGVTGVPLGVPDVLPALQTGMINAFYGSPLSVVALQWHTKAKFMSTSRLAFAVGAAVLRKSAFDALAPDLQKIVLEDARQLQERLLGQLRKDNDDAMQALRKAMIQEINPTPQMIQEFARAARAVQGRLEAGDQGKPPLYSRDLRHRVEALLVKECK